MAGIVVSGRMAVLFDRISLAVGGGEEDTGNVDGYRCRWCGWTYVVDDPKLIPDHDCHGATAAQYREQAAR